MPLMPIRAVAAIADKLDAAVREARRSELSLLFPDVDPSRIIFALVSAGGNARIAFGREAFDSELFGFEIGRIHSVRASSVADHRLLFEAVAAKARSAGYLQILR